MTDARKEADLAAARARHGVPADGLTQEQWEAWVADGSLAGTWRKFGDKRLVRVMPETLGDGHRLFYLRSPANLQSPYGARGSVDFLRLHTVPASPRDVLDAKLATLTPEQRARVHANGTDSVGNVIVLVDGESVYFGSERWWSRTSGRPDTKGYDNDIDRMLAALDAALAKPAPQALVTPLRLGPDGWTDGPLDKWEQTIADLRAQLAAVTAERDEARRVANAANCIGPWRWQGDAGDDLASMSDGMEITMLAGDLRALTAERDALLKERAFPRIGEKP